MAEAKKSIFSKAGKFFKETKSELKKVTWPSWASIKKNTGVIIAFVVIVGLFLFVCDVVFGGLRNLFVNLF